MFRFTLASIIYFLTCLSAAGQETPGIRNFRPQDYRAGNQNWAIAQSPEGWVYVGNNHGMLEFDGARWQTFYLPNRQTVRAVARGPRGEIFCGGYSEFGFWQKHPSGEWRYSSLSSKLPENALGAEEIWHIEVTEKFVLFQTFSKIFKYDYHTVHLVYPPNAIMFARAVKNRIFVPVIDQGLFELGPDDTFTRVPGGEVLAGPIVQFIVEGPGDVLWIGTSNQGLFELSAGRCRPSTHPLAGVFRQKQLNKALRLSTGGWAIGTILDGIYLLDSTGAFTDHLHRGNGLQNNTVLALTEDRHGNVWAGLDRGLDYISLRAPLRFYLDQNGHIGSVYSAVHCAGMLYIGTNHGVFVTSENDPGRNFQLIPGTQGQVWQLMAHDNTVFCGHNSGTFEIRGRAARKISEITGGWHTIPLPGHPDLLLQATYTGLVVFEKKNGNFTVRNRVAGFFSPLKRIAFDQNGYLWGVHPNKGLYRLHLDGAWSAVTSFKLFGEAEGLVADEELNVWSSGHQLWVNTRHNSFLITQQNGRDTFVSFTAGERWLPGTGKDKFILDSIGLWMEGQGAARYLLPLKLIPGYENIVPFDSNGQYLMCLEDGYARFQSRYIPRERPVDLPPVIRQVMAGDRILPLEGPHVVPYASNTFAFLFAAPSFERPPMFSWYLEGLSDHWSPWQDYPGQTFTNLPPGRYTLLVRTDENDAVTAFTFRITPPWYRSRWAIAAYVLIATGGFFVGEQISRRRLRHQRQRLEQEKIRALEEQRLHAERERLALEVDNKTRELSNAALSVVRKNEVLQALKDELAVAQKDPRAIGRILRHIDEHLEGDHDWEIFEATFNQVHDDFFKRLQQTYTDLTPGDLRLAAYLRMNLSSKEIAPLLNITVRGVENKRYRLRKKMGLEESDNLTQFILNF